MSRLASSARRWFTAGAMSLFGAALPLTATAAPSYAECVRAAPVDFPGTIAEAAIATPALSTLVDLVVAADLVGALSQPGDLTVFAPTNDAFAAIPAPVLGAIGSDLGLLSAVLTYHVVAGPADPRTAVTRKAATLQGQTLYTGFERGVGARINNSVAGCTAVRTTNGTVWVIDSVLLPQF